MGYESVARVATLRTYADAHKWWDRTKPIRGRAVDVRPLADRRHADAYSIRKNPQNDAIECVLYRTPVVTFMPDGEVHIRNGGYPSTSTHMFIEEVLRGNVRASSKMGKTVVRVGEQVVMLGSDEVLRIANNRGDYPREHVFEVLGAKTNYAYRINRKGANIVRARFKEFYDYFKGFTKLRSEEQEHRGSYRYENPRKIIRCTFDEIAEALGTTDGWGGPHSVASTDDWKGLTAKPGTYGHWHGHWLKVPQSTYENTMHSFVKLITSDQPGETKHLNFHKATIALLTYNHTISTRTLEEKSYTFDAETAKTTLDTALFKWFAPEVLERYEVPMGKVPETKYDSWMKGENT